MFQLNVQGTKSGVHGTLMIAGRRFKFNAVPESGSMPFISGYGPEVGGFWSDLGRGLKSALNVVTKTPLIRAAISAIPYGGAALTVADAAQQAITIAESQKKQRPKAAALARAVIKKDPRAAAIVNRLPPAQKNLVGQMAALQIDEAKIRQFIAYARAFSPNSL